MSVAVVSADFNINTSGYENLTSHAVVLTSTPIKAAALNATNGDVLNIAAGRYSEYEISADKSVTFSGSGRLTTTIDGMQGSSGIFSFSGLDITIRDLTITNGSGGLGGNSGAIFMSGSGSNSLSIESCLFSGNSAGWDVSGASGGAIYIQDGDLTVTGSTFTENSAGSSSAGDGGDGGAICVQDGDLTVTGSTFTENSAGSSSAGDGGDGGAICFYGGGTTLSILSSSFADNSGGDSTSGPGGDGGAVYYTFNSGGTVSIRESTFMTNTVGSGSTSGNGGFLFGNYTNDAAPVNASIKFNRIFANSGTTMCSDAIYGPLHNVDSTLNWWGNNTDPKDWGGVVNKSDTIVTTDPYLVLGISASPASITTSGTSTILTDLIHTNQGTDVSAQGSVPDGIPVGLGATLGTLSSTSLSTVKGEASTSFISSSTGTSTISATVDDQTVSTDVEITSSPSSVGSGSSGGSSGGNIRTGSPPAYINTVTTAGSIKPGGKATFTIAQSAVYEIVFTSCNGTEKIMLTLVWASQPSDNVNKTGRPTYEYEDVDLYYIEEDDLCGCLFRFKLPKNWFDTLGIDPNDIVMTHWNGEEWEPLPTYMIDDTGSFYYYESYIKSFSWFAIIVEKDATDMSKFDGGGEETATPTEQAAQASTPKTETQDTPQAGSSVGNYTFIPLALCILFFVLAGIIIAGLMIRRKKGKYPDWWFKEK